ncbi:MAG: tocopherol cyclase family protein, partial [Anaerolineae bacterium]
MLSETVRRRLHPEGYQGAARRAPYFDGWYFKVVDAAEQARYAIIPGISLAKEDGGPHSFVQVLDGVTGDTLYQRYTVEAFAAAADTLDVMVGPNRFTWRGMALDLGSSRLPLRGTIAFRGVQPWPVTLLSPGIMGWYAWAPFMECYHGVLSLDHGLTGTLETGAGAVSFDGGRGYIEKDWGQAFPSAWIWLQTNHFATPGTCLTGSVARIPWIGTAFSGFIVGLLWNGQL